MASPSPNNHRIHTDVMQLMNNHEVLIRDSLNQLDVKFHGPVGTLYEGGVWNVRVQLPEDYPLKPPNLTIRHFMFHPNINGTVCMDIIETNWLPIYTLCHVFELFLPQLLAEPNPEDALDSDAAELFKNNPDEYKATVEYFVKKSATKEAQRSPESDEWSSEYEEWSSEEEA